jgi:hypothetical protein
MVTAKDFKIDDEFRDRTCDALLLEFKEPKVYDLTIPDEHNLHSLVVIAGRILNGQKVDPKKVNCVTTSHEIYENRLLEEKFSLLSPKVSKGLFNILKVRERGEKSDLYWYLHHEDLFGHEWHMLRGDWYRFRDGQRGRAEQRVQDYFDKKEIEDFNKVGKIIQPYIGLTNSACKIKD